MTGGLVTAGSGHDWENELVSALGRPGAPLSVVRRCVDVADLLAVAGTGQASVVVVAADLRRLTSDAVQRLSAAGVAVVGVFPADDQRARVRLERIGVSTVVADDAGAQALADAARTAVLERSLGGPTGSTGLADPRSAIRSDAVGGHPDLVPPNGFGADEPQPEPARPGRVIAVWGPTGAPGRTMLALNLAAEIAESGASTLLVDADTYGGVIANALGLLDESPGLAGACRMAANGRLDATQLAALSWQVGPMRVLTGIARTDRWPEVRASAIPAVLAIARSTASAVVIDCGFGLEADEEITFDTAAPRRNGATLAVLAEADVVLAVGSADPPGMERLMRGLADLAVVLPETDPRVVLNRQRRSAAGKDEAADAVARFAGAGVLAVLPEDREATDKAWRSGLPLSRAAAGSALRSAISELSRTVAPAPAGAAAAPGRR